MSEQAPSACSGTAVPYGEQPTAGEGTDRDGEKDKISVKSNV